MDISEQLNAANVTGEEVEPFLELTPALVEKRQLAQDSHHCPHGRPSSLMFTRHAKGKRFSDVSDNAFYWYFVVASWVPLYALIYGVPRL